MATLINQEWFKNRHMPAKCLYWHWIYISANRPGFTELCKTSGFKIMTEAEAKDANLDASRHPVDSGFGGEYRPADLSDIATYCRMQFGQTLIRRKGQAYWRTNYHRMPPEIKWQRKVLLKRAKYYRRAGYPFATAATAKSWI